MIDSVRDFYSSLKQDGILFCFSGPISQGIVEGIGETLRRKMELEAATQTVSHRVFAIFVEQIQNIVNYSAETIEGAESTSGDIRHGIIIVAREPDARFCIVCGNYIEKLHGERLTSMLDRLQTMDKDELKAFYKEQRKLDRSSESKGAGLGLIEMARKASQPVTYQLESNEQDSFAFISIKVVI